MDFSADYSLKKTQRADFLLYLDYDGVLHSEHVYVSRKRGIYIDEDLAPGRSLFEWMNTLEELIAPYPELRIVLSTTWARKPGFQGALKRLSGALQERVIGATFHRAVHARDPLLLRSFIESPRGEQVLADVLRRRPLAWLALDDNIACWPKDHLDALVACDGEVGLSSLATQNELRTKLERMAALIARQPSRTPRP